MEGGVTVILTLLILGGIVFGAIWLLGAGGYAQRRKEQEDLARDDARHNRPEHTAVEDDSGDVLVPRDPGARTAPPE